MVVDAIKVKCAIAIDSSNPCIGEIIREMLPAEWQPHVTVSSYSQWTDVIEMVRNALPALLVIHTNLFLLSPKDGIEHCAAVSSNTRYLFLTAWSEEHIDDLLKFCEPFHASVLRMPFNRAQLIAALAGAYGVHYVEDSWL